MLHDYSLLNKITKATISDQFTNEIMVRLNAPFPEVKSLDLDHFTTRDGLLYRNHLLYVPEGSCCTRVLKPAMMILFSYHIGVTVCS